MRKVRCYECGKQYDYDEDGFCPKCGAFNPPSTDGGAVVREGGLNERNHARSFVHAELHQEDRKRRNTPLETAERQTPRRNRQGGKPLKGFWTFFIWLIILLVFLSFLNNMMLYF